MVAEVDGLLLPWTILPRLLLNKEEIIPMRPKMELADIMERVLSNFTEMDIHMLPPTTQVP
jgi:hypothetical protein